MADELWRLGACDLAAAIRRKDISCVEAVQAALDRLHQANRAVNAVTVDLGNSALKAAKEHDRMLASGVELGPLFGIPVTVKENVDQTGQSTPNGLEAMGKLVATADSPVVANLRRAGAIIIGRTNTPEFSFRWFTDNPLRGLTLNPWDPERTPGGSSGGAAASVALGIGAVAHGNDLGGSLRYPAYCCGVATIRPSLGRVPAYNPTQVEERPPSIQLMSVQGPIAREVRDVRLALKAMTAEDFRDPWHAPVTVDRPRVEGHLRVALTFGPGSRQPAKPVAEALEAAGNHLTAAGYRVEYKDPPEMEMAARLWRNLIFTESRIMMARAVREYGSADVQQIFDHYEATGDRLDLEGYMRALAERTRLARAWARFMQDYPLILAPVSQALALPQGEDLRGRERVREILQVQETLYVVNLLGLPAAALPTGIVDGLPVGVQIIGQRFRDGMCLDAAQSIENRVGILARKLWERE